MSYRIAILNESSISDLFRTDGISFGTQMLTEKWKNKHYNNPAGESCIFGAFDGDRLVGINSFLKIEFVYKGMTIKAVESGDSAVDPEYRRKGIFSQLIRYAENYLRNAGYDVIIGFPNTENAYPGFLKLGWLDLCHVKNELIIVDLKKFINDIYGINVPILFNLIPKIMCLGTVLRAKREKSIKLSLSKSVPFDSFESFAKGEYISQNISKRTIDWKFSSDTFVYYNVRNANDEVIASFVFGRYKLRGKFDTLTLVHNFNNTTNEKEFVNAYSFVIHDILKKNSCTLIRKWKTKDNLEIRADKKCGFLTIKKCNPFIVNILTEDEEKKKLLADANNWNPMMIDLDVA
jgi:GNAT superfamily N-acetyltransferase